MFFTQLGKVQRNKFTIGRPEFFKAHIKKMGRLVFPVRNIFENNNKINTLFFANPSSVSSPRKRGKIKFKIVVITSS